MTQRAWRAALAALLFASTASFTLAQEADDGVWYYAAEPPMPGNVELVGGDDGEVIEGGEYVPQEPAYIEHAQSQDGYVAYDDPAYQEDACCGDVYDDCCKHHKWWGRAEWLMWWLRGASAPPLVTTSPDGTPPNEAGVLPDAEVLYPTEDLGTAGRPGGRFTIGYYLDNAEKFCLEGSYFTLQNSREGFAASSDLDGEPILARPYIDAATGDEEAFPVSYPGVVAGQITIAAASSVSGAEANLRWGIGRGPSRRLDFIAGYRFLQLNESLGIYEEQLAIDPVGIIPLDTIINTTDQFATKNDFHGGQFGLKYQTEYGKLSFDWVAKVALGNMHQFVNINGVTAVSVPGDPTEVYSGGILALDSNMGRYNRNRFVAIPEFGVNAKLRLDRLWTVNVGYTFMLLSHVVRPGDQIDRQIDLDQVPPAQGQGEYPEFRFVESNAWLQGVNVGLECRF